MPSLSASTVLAAACAAAWLEKSEQTAALADAGTNASATSAISVASVVLMSFGLLA